MADNVAITAGIGSTIATDEISGVHYQKCKLAFGPNDTATLVDASTGLPVNVLNTSFAVTDGGGSLTVDGTVGITGTVGVTGTFWQATQPISAASLPLPTGAATETSLANAVGRLTTIEGAVTGSLTVDAPVGTPVFVRLSDGTSPISTLPVSDGGSTLSVDDGGGSLTVDGTVGITGTVGVTGTFWQATQPVSLASVPTHAVTQSGTWTVQPGNTANTTAWLVTGTGGTFPVTDSGGSLTVDAPVGTPVFVRLSDGSSAITTLAVSLASLPALAAGSNLIGSVIAPHQTGAVYSGTTALTPKFAKIDGASSGNNTVIAAVTSKKIRVLSYRLVGAADVNVKFTDGAGGSDLTGAMSTGAKGGGGGGAFSPVGHFETSSNTALVMNLSAAVQVSGHVVYIEV